ncbi:hypothetical protein [Alkaliflexus imshenetskii]|uniref:hypothetical protein n=1 Tax=Alkaliflexus imshenetskii TaxID=286730 RepID=UPI0004B24B3D|nr:hypothetical protein [Alkaliflexus imshenetskii]
MSFDEEPRRVHIISVNNARLPSVNELEARLNSIYRQAVCTWTVIVQDPVTLTFPGGRMTHGGSGTASTYNSDQHAIATAFESSGRQMEPGSLYLFFVEDVTFKDRSLAGYMPLQRQVGFIYGNPTLEVVAHELAHGAFMMRHTFSPKAYIIGEGQTQNLMDYAGGTELWKHQWDLIHNPESILFAWSQSEEEGAAYMTLVTKEGKGIGIDLPDYEKKYSFLTPSLVPIWIKDAEEIKFFDNGTVSSFVVGGVKYAAIVNDLSTYFNCYYEYDDFLKLKQDRTRQVIDGIVISQDLDQSKIYSNYQLGKQDDPVFVFTDYTRLGISCIKIETFKVRNAPEGTSKISGQFKDIELPEATTEIAQSGECKYLDIVKQYNIGDGIGRDFFILFYPGCNESQTKINELVSFCQELNQDEADNCRNTKHQITDAFAEKLRNKGVVTLGEFLENYYIGYTLGALVISEVDLWIYLTDDYNSVSQWEYSAAELKVRYKLLQDDNPLAKGILENETNGNAQPLTGEAFVRKYGDASSLVAFILFFQLEAELLNIESGVNVINRASGFFKRAKTKPFSSASIADKKMLVKLNLGSLEKQLKALKILPH